MEVTGQQETPSVLEIQALLSSAPSAHMTCQQPPETAWGQTSFWILSAEGLSFHWSLSVKDICSPSNEIQRLRKKSIELGLFLWSLGKTDLGFDSLKMRNLPCSVRSEIGVISLFFSLPPTPCFKPSGDDLEGQSAKVPCLLGQGASKCPRGGRQPCFPGR